MNGRLLRTCLALMIAPALIGASRPILVPEVSQRQIDIVYSFTGAEVLLFGAIVYPDGRAPDRLPDIAVTLRGPVQSVLMREKQKIAGIWVNADRTRFRSVPSFYAVASTRPISDIVDERTAAIFELGLGNLQLSPASGDTPAEQRRFELGMIDLKRRTGLFSEQGDAVQIVEKVLYQARIRIPARVPVGQFTAETFMIQDGRIVAAASRDIEIRKSGFERFVALAAEQHSIVYGLAAVLLSILLGWGAGLIFRRI